MSDIEKIRQEIERRKKRWMYDDLPIAMGRYYEDRDLLAFIDSMTDPLNDPKFCEGFDVGRAVQRIFDETEETCKDSLQVQETCKENQDSFTDQPKEMSVDEAMAYLDEKIAKARASKSWEGVDIDKFLDDLRGREHDDLEEAAEDSWALYEYRETPQGLYSSCYRDGFISGAKWMESQMPVPEDTVIFMKGVKEGRRLEREDRNDDKLPRFYGD